MSKLLYVRGNAVLSLGCGPTLLDDSSYYYNTPKSLVGIDINKANLDFITNASHPEIRRQWRRVKEQGVQVRLICDDLRRYKPEFARRFDTVYAMGVLGMLPEQTLSKVLPMIVNYIRPGGVFLNIDWCDHHLKSREFHTRKKYQWYDKGGPDIPKVVGLIEESGIVVNEHEVYSVASPSRYGWGKIYSIVGRKPRTSA